MLGKNRCMCSWIIHTTLKHHIKSKQKVPLLSMESSLANHLQKYKTGYIYISIYMLHYA